VMYANGMGISFHTEPHILAGSVSPTIGRRNITLPTDNGLNSIEWRLRKEQTKGKVTVFGRKLRVISCFLKKEKKKSLMVLFKSRLEVYMTDNLVCTYN